MSKYIPGNHKHLTLDERCYIQDSLDQGMTFKDISCFLCKDPTTISKEVTSRKFSDWYHKGTFYNAHNFCIHRFHCKKTNACNKILLCGVKCSSCPTCNQTCKYFEKERCSRLDHAPYVCNGCDQKINHCTIAHKYKYDARFADRKYKEKLTDSRAGINLTKHELRQKDMIISPLIENGQSPYQIITNHPELGLNSFVEMDTVHSSRESRKTLLTFFFTKEKLFLAFLMNRCTKGAVRLVFDRLEKAHGNIRICVCF